MKLFQGNRAKWNPDYTYDDGFGELSDWSAGQVPNIETFNPWHLPLMNTLILLLSGTTVTWAHHALIHGDRKGAKIPMFTDLPSLWRLAFTDYMFLLGLYSYSFAGCV